MHFLKKLIVVSPFQLYFLLQYHVNLRESTLHEVSFFITQYAFGHENGHWGVNSLYSSSSLDSPSFFIDSHSYYCKSFGFCYFFSVCSFSWSLTWVTYFFLACTCKVLCRKSTVEKASLSAAFERKLYSHWFHSFISCIFLFISETFTGCCYHRYKNSGFCCSFSQCTLIL